MHHNQINYSLFSSVVVGEEVITRVPNIIVVLNAIEPDGTSVMLRIEAPAGMKVTTT